MSPNGPTTGFNLEPCFPPELEREISETAAVLDPTLIPPLLRICHRVRAWVEPLLYTVLTINGGNSPILCAAETKSASFLHNAVRHVFLELFIKKLSGPRGTLLKNCTGVTNLYFEGTFDIQFLDVLGTMPLRKLSFSAPRDVAEKRKLLQHPILRSLTHLDLYEPSGRTWEGWYGLAALPALTHLCLSSQLSNMLLHAMEECPRLVVAVIAFWGVSEREDAISFAKNIATMVTDPRLVVLVVSDYDKDWGVGARGGDDFWIRAEAFITEKRREDCYFLDEIDMRI
ncbi:hypothetical protein DFH06DRAFT_1226563 [Mycena polygramma]|nr:hypothetical protein DFH06DRAFT_1226563 [Mycena polygramma]